MKKIKSGVASLSIATLCLTAVAPVSAATGENNNLKTTVQADTPVDWKFEYNSIEEVPKELFEPGYYSEEEIIYLPSEYLNPYHPDTISTTYANGDSKQKDGEIRTMAFPIAAAGIYMIPGIGQVAITATGGLIVAGVAVSAGSWIYNKVSAYFSEKAAKEAAAKIPKSLKKSGSSTTVDLSKFKDKFGKTPLSRTSGTFKNGKWVITKDSAGHIGYDGTKKAWKIGNPKRVGSLNKNGKVIDE